MTWRAGSLSEYADLVRWTPPPWLRAAACRGQGRRTSWWFREGGTVMDRNLRERARAICMYECPVRYRCLARYLHEPSGIFGGLDADERTQLKSSVHYKSWDDPDALRLKLEKRLTVTRGEVSVSIQVS